MQTGPTVASRLAAALRTVLGAEELPWRLRAWDGSEAGPAGASVLVVRSPVAVRRLAWAPGELGLGTLRLTALRCEHHSESEAPAEVLWVQLKITLQCFLRRAQIAALQRRDAR